MSEYHLSLIEIRQWTIPQLLFFVDKVMDRHERDLRKDAKLHGAEFKKPGLDYEGTTAIENIIPEDAIGVVGGGK
jgi:hypothetical protein